MILMMLPNNDIKLNENEALNYGIVKWHEPWIGNDRMYGYFEGDIEGMGDDEIKDGDYGAKGDMTLDDHCAPFQFMVSNKVINNMFAVILTHNQIGIDAPYSKFVETNFPVDWTSTQLEGALPGFTSIAGYDKPLSMTFMNEGTPLFNFTEKGMSI